MPVMQLNHIFQNVIMHRKTILFATQRSLYSLIFVRRYAKLYDLQIWIATGATFINRERQRFSKCVKCYYYEVCA